MKNGLKKIGKALSALFLLATVAWAATVRWVMTTWAHLSMEELVYQLNAPIEGTNSELIMQGVLQIGLPLLAGLVLLIVLLWKVRSKKLWWGLVLLAAFLDVAIGAFAWNRLDVTTYLQNQGTDSTFIEENYVDPAGVDLQFPEKKRNLVYIYLESMETTYADDASGGGFGETNVIPELTALALENESFSGDSSRINGGYVMPGLINLHVHLPASGKPTVKQKDPKKAVRLMTSNALLRSVAFRVCAGYAKTELLSGVTTLRSVGGIQAIDSRLRDKILSGGAVGPRILAGNMAVSVPGGHMAGSLAYEATSPKNAAALGRKIAQNKPDLIKLMITGGVLDAKCKGEPGELKMSPALVKAACDQAHALGLPVAAHVESPQGVRVALEGGVDTIEHGARPDEEILRLFEERKACHIATISPALPYALFDRSVTGATETEQYNGKLVMDGIIACAKACLARGIPVGLGTDTGCPYITHYDMWREVYYFHKFCGVSNAFALHTATLGNARIAGLGEETGSVEPGKCADLIVTRQNPLEDLKALRHVDLVIARGKVYRSPKVKKIEKAQRELDKFL